MVQRRQVSAAKEDLSGHLADGFRGQETRQGEGSDALAAAGLTHYGHRLTCAELEGYAFNGLEFAEANRKAGYLKKRGVGRAHRTVLVDLGSKAARAPSPTKLARSSVTKRAVTEARASQGA